MSNKQLHVVFGAGQIGPPLARRLLAEGHEVRVVRRSAGAVTPGTTLMQGDAGDPAFASQASQGATAIYHVMNPVYASGVWERELPRLADSLIAAAGRAGARLVVLDNLYMLGRTHGRPISEDLPSNPNSRKGELRARVAAALFEAHQRGTARVISGRASDFYGPGGINTHMGEMLWKRVLAGKSAQLLVNPDTLHTYHYTLDVAAGLAALGGAPEDAFGKWWVLPAASAVTTRALIAEFARSLPHGIAVERLPRPLLGVMGLFMPVLREVSEMLYQWDEPFVVDDSRFREAFALRGTPLAEGAVATVAWAKAAFGPA